MELNKPIDKVVAKFKLTEMELTEAWANKDFKLENDAVSDKVVSGEYTKEGEPDLLEIKKDINWFLNNLALASAPLDDCTFSKMEDYRIENGLTISTKIHFKRTPSDLDIVLKNMKKLECLSEIESIKRILSSYRAGLTEEDRYVKFFGMWRAFNGLYRIRYPRDKYRYEKTPIKKWAENFNKERIKDIVGHYNHILNLKKISTDEEHESRFTPLNFVLFNLRYKNLFHALSDKNYDKVYGGDNKFGEELKLLLEKDILDEEDYQSIFTNALLCIYQVRKGIFHGESYEEAEEDFIYLCSVFLSAVVREGIMAMVKM